MGIAVNPITTKGAGEVGGVLSEVSRMTLKPSFPRCGGEGIEEEEEGVGADETRGSGFEGVPVGAEQGVGVGGLVEVEVSELLPQFSFYE